MQWPSMNPYIGRKRDATAKRSITLENLPKTIYVGHGVQAYSQMSALCKLLHMAAYLLIEAEWHIYSSVN